MLELEDVIGWTVTRADNSAVTFDVAKLVRIESGKAVLSIMGAEVSRCPVLNSYLKDGPTSGDIVLYVKTGYRGIVVLGKIGP